MGNVVRVGDLVSCGDHAAEGSPTVYANGMPIVTVGNKITTGHGCFPPTVFVGRWTTTVFVNKFPVALLGTKTAGHWCGKSFHEGSAVTAAATVSFEF